MRFTARFINYAFLLPGMLAMLPACGDPTVEDGEQALRSKGNHHACGKGKHDKHDCEPACQPDDCGPALGMPNLLCDDGIHYSGPGACVDMGGTCGWEILTCPTTPCGGFLGLACEDPNQECVDDPNDDCDPNQGGADCGGICVEAGPTFCGGFANFPCPQGELCVDDPNDDCDPNQGGADCGGVCITPAACGGFGGIACEGKGEVCVDDPNDDCDPDKGGADCIGICVPG